MLKVVKVYWMYKEFFILDQDGFFWKQDEGIKVLVFLSIMIVEVMNLCYDVFFIGYQGVSRILSWVKE